MIVFDATGNVQGIFSIKIFYEAKFSDQESFNLIVCCFYRLQMHRLSLIYLAEKLQDLLMFCTGTNHLPPLGFHEPAKKAVMQLDELCGKLPNSNTCPQELELLSVHNKYEAFKYSMNCALAHQSSGFSIIYKWVSKV